MDSKPKTLVQCAFMSSASRSPPREACVNDPGNGSISLQEWQGWGTTSPVPAMVTKIVEELKALETDIDAPMSFGGSGGKLQGYFKVQEDKKHRATYQALCDSEEKLQFFSARQIACRLLGSRGYLCQKCWLPLEDCMCSRVIPCNLWHGMRFWLYMHPKDFLRQNNTGKLLWQVFGIEAATLCLYGIAEHEEIMWSTFKDAGKNNEQAKSIWGEEDFPCIALATGASAMHKLRPQPSWDRTCTAAAAIGLLSELQLLPVFSSFGLDKLAEAVEHALVVLLEALTARRLRMGRCITRRVRHNSNIC